MAGDSSDSAKEADEEAPSGDRPLVCLEEWLEPAGRTVLGEYHKQGLPKGCLKVYRDRELEGFSGLISDKGAVKFHSEYHKEGAPLIGETGYENPPPAAPAAFAAPETGGPSPDDRPLDAEVPASDDPPSPASPPRDPAGRSPLTGVGKLMRKLPAKGPGGIMDLPTIELAAYVALRAMFGDGVTIPIRREGLIDMDVQINGKEIRINSNRFMLELPELSVFHIVFAYKGKPVVEYGRGVTNNIKIHRYRAFMLLVGMWWNGRRARKEKLRKARAGRG